MTATPPVRAARTTREEQARREIGHTAVTPALARAIVVGFLLVLLAGLGATLWLVAHPQAGAALRAPGARLAASLRDAARTAEGPFARTMAANGELRRRMRQFEEALDDAHPAATRLRGRVQTLLCRLGVGNEKVLLGRGGWLYYEPDVLSLTGRGWPPDRRAGAAPRGDAVEAVVAFRDDLAAHGIRLVLLPVPVKPSIHPEGLAPRANAPATAWRSRGYDAWRTALAARDVTVLDCAPELLAEREASGRAYLQSDTHWTPAAMERVARQLAAHLALPPPPDGGRPPAGEAMTAVTQAGDTAGMLPLPPGDTRFAPETVHTRPVRDAEAPDAAVILLGDSFANIYSLAEMGWGAHAGLAERLALTLGQPVRRFVRNDSGAWASRERFATAIARGDIDLAAVRVVVWQFAERELALGDWRHLPLPAARPQRDTAAQAAPGEMSATGRIEAVSDGPNRNAVYRDFVIKWHVRDLRTDTAPDAPGGEAVIHLYGMRDRAVLPAAALRPGTRVRLRLRPWQDVEATVGALNAGTLEDAMLELDLPLYWAEATETLPETPAP